jgi:hypothetical protein
MRICIGLSEICNMVSTYAEGFRAAGHTTLTVVWRHHAFYRDATYDRCLDDYKFNHWKRSGLRRVIGSLLRHAALIVLLIEALVKCDVFLLISGGSFLPRGWDLPVMRLLGKRIVAVFVGSDIRQAAGYRREMERRGLAEEVGPFLTYLQEVPDRTTAKRRLVRRIERYATMILSQPGNGQLQRRPYMRLNIPVHLREFRRPGTNSEVPLLLHAPSNRDIKGTSEILAAVERLHREGFRFEFRLVERMANKSVLELLCRSDIVVDDLYADTVGTLALEAMAAGNAVLVHYLPDYTKVPPYCPALNVSRTSLVSSLASLIGDRELMEDLGCRGRAYVERHHDHVRVAKEIVTWLADYPALSYDFAPRGSR